MVGYGDTRVLVTAFAQQHLRMLSGLYGVLRPLDLMQPYRLEMGIRLENARGKDLYRANLLMRKFGARKWIGCTTLLWGVLSAAMAWADTEAKFLLVRTLLGAAEAGFFPGMIYLTSQWFPQQNRASIMGLFYMGAPLALTLGSPLSGALLEMHGFMGHPGWFWMFVIEGLLAG